MKNEKSPKTIVYLVRENETLSYDDMSEEEKKKFGTKLNRRQLACLGFVPVDNNENN